MNRARFPDIRQLTLDALFLAPPSPRDDAGALDVSAQTRESLADLLAEAKARTDGRLDRYAVAAAMSRLSARDISKNMLDRYCAPSAEEWRFPLEALPALVAATGDYRLLDLIAEACGCRVLRGEEAWLAEYAARLVEERHAKERRAAFEKALPAEAAQRLVQEARRRQETGDA